MDELKQKRRLFFSTAYVTNINYLVMLILICNYVELDNDRPYISLAIWGIPAFISVLISTVVIRNNLMFNLSRQEGLLKLAITHSLSLLGLMGAIIYLFI